VVYKKIPRWQATRVSFFRVFAFSTYRWHFLLHGSEKNADTQIIFVTIQRL